MTGENTFRALFIQAQYALPPDLGRVVSMRYGYPEGRPHTLEEIGWELGGLTQERIRQLLYRALIVIRCTGMRQIGRNETTGESALLLLYLREAIKPEAPGVRERIVAFAREEVAPLPPQKYGLPLVVTLLYGRGKQARFLLSEALQLDREVLSAEVQEQLRRALQQSPADGGLWDSRKVMAWVYTQTGLEIDQKQGRAYLIRLNCPVRKQRPPQSPATQLGALVSQ
jgi:AcrR family transcriptional regulator